jgi:hypothetical protein
MKKTLFILLALTIFCCSTDDDNNMSNDPDATILGRWVIVGFEDAIRYEFTAEKRFAIYSEDGVFPSLEEFNSQNPQLTGLDWFYDGDIVEIDLNFGNSSRLRPEFVCNNYVIQWYNEEGEPAGVYHREGFDISTCTEVTID